MNTEVIQKEKRSSWKDYFKVSSSSFACVIECNGQSVYDILHPITVACDENGVSYWAIRHDLDLLEDGTLKRPHIHIVLDFGKNTRVSRVFRLLAVALGESATVVFDGAEIPNPRLSVDVAHNRTACIRYLCHMDSEDKVKYAPCEVYSNDYGRFDLAMRANGGQIDVALILDLLQEGNGSLVYILKALGCSLYNKYRNVILDLKKEMNL